MSTNINRAYLSYKVRCYRGVTVKREGLETNPYIQEDLFYLFQFLRIASAASRVLSCLMKHRRMYFSNCFLEASPQNAVTGMAASFKGCDVHAHEVPSLRYDR